MPKSLALVLLAACSVPVADAGQEQPSRTATPYSCDGLTVAPQTATVNPAILAPWRTLAAETDTTTRWAIEVNAALALHPPGKLGIEEKVRLQHELLRIAEGLDRGRRSDRGRSYFESVHRQVMARIRATAPTAAELATLGASARPDVHAVLGPATSIVERATATCGEGNSIHAHYNAGRLAFRPLRTGTTRALVAQIVAFDTEGAPHITPLVEGMELRLGNEVSSPACVIQARPDGTLRPAALADVEEHAPFVMRRETGLGCIGCHAAANTMNARDIAGPELETVDQKRDAQVDQLASRLWKTLAEPLAATP